MVTLMANERGVALPMATFFAFMLTAVMAAALTMSSAERRVLDSSIAQLDAFSVAQTGLEQFQVRRAEFGFTDVPPAPYESTRVDVGLDYADVVLELVRPSVAGSPPLYVIRSHGVLTGPTLTGTLNGERIVGQYATWQTGTMNVPSAFTSLSGLHKNGGSGTITGTDECAGLPEVAGVAVPTSPGYTQNGGPPVPTGTPPIDDLGSVADAADQITIDWAGIVDGTALIPDIEIPGASWPSFANPSYWPVIKVTGNYSLPSSGRGVLIVTGSLTINGSKSWDGVLLVGEHIVGNGNQQVSGAMISGLNVKLAADPAAYAAAMGQNTIGNGTKTIRYNSCFISQALSSFGGLTMYRNAWLDNWTTY